MPQPLLSGEQEYMDRDEPTGLRDRIAELERDLREAKQESARARGKSASIEIAVAELRKILNPLHNFLRVLYGELDAIPVDEIRPAVAPGNNPKWENWKQKMPGRPAEMIDLLLLHENMSTKQLMAAMHCAKDTVYQAAFKLGQAGLVSNNGGRYSLKQL